MAYKAIIFDFFDVIHADPLHTWLRIHGLEREGAVDEISQQLDLGAINVTEFFRRLGTVTAQSTEQVAAEFNDAMRLDEQVVELIKQLKPSYKVAVLSNAHAEELLPLLEKHELHALFDVVVISSEVGHIKPNPEIFEHAVTKLGISNTEALFIDDNPKNVEGAERYGLTGLLFTGVDRLRADLRRLGIFDETS